MNLRKNLPDRLESTQEEYYLTKMLNNDKNARDMIINHNLWLIVVIIRLFFSYDNFNLDELFSEGIIGLIKAADNYHNFLYIPFKQYAFRCIYDVLLKKAREKRKIVKPLSLEDIIINDDQNELNKINTFNNMIDIDTIIVDKNIYEIVRFLVNNLPEPKKSILKMYYGFDKYPLTEVQISKLTGLSQPRISKIIKESLALLKKLLANYEIKDYNRVNT